MTRLDRFPSAINNKFHHFYEAIKIQAGYFIIIISCLGWRRLEGRDWGCPGKPLKEPAELRQSHGVTTLQGLRIPGMPSACVTVIITSRYLMVEGGGVRCHCPVTEGCWFTAADLQANTIPAGSNLFWWDDLRHYSWKVFTLCLLIGAELSLRFFFS